MASIPVTFPNIIFPAANHQREARDYVECTGCNDGVVRGICSFGSSRLPGRNGKLVLRGASAPGMCFPACGPNLSHRLIHDVFGAGTRRFNRSF